MTISEVALIDVETLKKRLREPERDQLRLIHVAELQAFQQQHIPGAIQVAPAELISGEPPASGKLPSVERLNALFSRLGYSRDCSFILYDDEGGGWAGRFAWTLDMIGHRSWQYLNGGIQAWVGAGEIAESGAGSHPQANSVSIQLNRQPQASLNDVLDAIDDPEQLIWDVRSEAEYSGQRSGSSRAGHIPGALNLDWLALKDPDNQQRLRGNLSQLLENHGIDLSRRVITHCQTHHRSGLSYMVARLLGCQDIRAYDGSWSEWGNHPDTPIAT